MQAVAVWQGDRLAARQEAVLRGMWARQREAERMIEANRMGKALVTPDRATFARGMVTELKAMIGEGRFNDPAEITRILAVSDLPFRDGGDYTAYCDPAITFVACKALALANGEILNDVNAVRLLQWYRPLVDKHYFVTQSSCTATRDSNHSLWLPVELIKDNVDIPTGTLILFQFSTEPVLDRHIGIVDVDGGDTFADVEANTTSGGHSGMIASKTRNWDYVWGFVFIAGGRPEV